MAAAAKAPDPPQKLGIRDGKPALWEGIVKKKKPGGLWESWQTRYFRLFPDVLLYYESKVNPTALGAIPIQTIKSVDYDKGKRGTTPKFNISVVAGAGTAMVTRVFDLESTQQRDTDFIVDKIAALIKSNTDASAASTPGGSAGVGQGADKFWKNTISSPVPSGSAAAAALASGASPIPRNSASAPAGSGGPKSPTNKGITTNSAIVQAFDEDDNESGGNTPPSSQSPAMAAANDTAASASSSTKPALGKPASTTQTPSGATKPPPLVTQPSTSNVSSLVSPGRPPPPTPKEAAAAAAASPAVVGTGVTSTGKSPPPPPIAKQLSSDTKRAPPPAPAPFIKQPSKLPGAFESKTMSRPLPAPPMPDFTRPKSSSFGDGNDARPTDAATPPTPASGGSGAIDSPKFSGNSGFTNSMGTGSSAGASISSNIRREGKDGDSVGMLEIGLPTHDTIFGKIFRARIRRTDDYVLLHTVFRTDPCFDDAKLLHSRMAKINSPYVFKQLNAGDTLDTLWAVYAYPPYHSLLHHVRANRRFPEKVVRHYAAQTVSLFKELHMQGLICRNLSPENMYIDGLGRSILCDFFLTQQNTKKIPSVHAVEYDTPEFVSKGDDDRASDWWRLGVLMYELAVGFPPIRLSKPSAAAAATAAASANPNTAAAAVSIAAAVANDNRDIRASIQSFQLSTLKFPPFVSTEFKDIVSKLLTPDRAKRLGAKPDDAKEVMKHAFFTSGAGGTSTAAGTGDIDWDKVATGAWPAPPFVLEKLVASVSPKPSDYARAPKRLFGDVFLSSELPFTQFFSPTLASGGEAAQRRARKKQSLVQRRFVRDGFDLDLTYITPRMLVMAGVTNDDPSESASAVGLNNTGEVYRFFKHHHDKRYRIANLSPELKYDKRAFDPGSIIDYPTEEFGVPNFDALIRYCEEVHKWLNADPANVVATHCRTGTGRSGLFVCCYLLFDKTCSTGEAALSFFAKHRMTDALTGLNLPSQRRYVKYFEQYLTGYSFVGKPFPGAEKRLTLTTIRMTAVPNFETPPSAAGCDPYFVLSRLDRRVFYNHKTGMRNVVPFFLRDPDPNFVPGGTSVVVGPVVTGANGGTGPSLSTPSIVGVDSGGATNPSHVDIRCNVTFYGDVKLAFYDYEKSGADQKMFWLYLNPNFVTQNYFCLPKDQIEGAMKDKECKHFPAHFKLELYFANAPAVKEAITLSDPDPTLS